MDSATIVGGDAATILVPPPASSHDPEATVLMPAVAGPGLNLDAGATVMMPAAPGGDPDATILRPAPSSGDPEATVLRPPTSGGAPADVTTLSTPSRSTAGGEDGPLTVGEVFGRYTIVKLLGIGGMGAVYQAWDKELEVVVALKVIRPEALRDPEAEAEIERRFKRELLLARQVTHRNVVRIHDLGEIKGIKYITMSYVDGKDLATVLKEAGKLPIAVTLRTMRSVVSGLVAAHAAGVVHRDLKPANIMIGADGEALIMDFGIARSTGGPTEASARAQVAPLEGLTATGRYTEATVLGSIVGTVEYMAPEQARGEAVDQRADIYTTGLILYDMLTGKRRAERPGSALDQLRARMESALPPLKSLAPDVPDALAAIITKATDPDAGARYQTTVELADALDRLDEHGVPKPIKRVVSLPRMAAIVAAVLALSAGAWWYLAPEIPQAAPAPVSVVIADFDNRTNEPAFDRTLEPTLRRALEGAGFITAYDRNGIRRIVGVELPAKIDEAAARELAVKQGLGVVLSGSIEKQGSRYAIAMRAVHPVTGEVLADVKARASGQDQVIATATKLVSSVRKSLGDRTTSESDQIFAMTSLSASSLDVVRFYAAAQEASTNNKFEDARQALLKAVELDPNFGVGYLALAGVSRNLGQPADAETYINQALSRSDGMTEREKYTTRGMFFRLTGDYQQCVKEHKELISRYEADVIGQNQLALCASQLRDLATAVSSMQKVVNLLPKRAVFRDNLALYSNYAGDFETGEKEARTVQEIVTTPDAYAGLALGFAQMGKGLVAEAQQTFTSLATTPGLGSTLSASGLADLAVYEGRYADAVRLSETGAAADLAAKSPHRAAAKLVEHAYAQLLRGQKAAAVKAGEKALASSQVIKIRFLAARIFIEAGQPAKAEPLMASLAAEVQPEPQAYGKILEAMMAVASKDARPAIKLLTDANTLLDTWIGHYELGRAYLATGQFPQADSEFDRCLKRRGEALALFLDEEPTYGYFPMVYYYQGRVREGMKLAGSAESYGEYLKIREKAGEDPLIAEIRRRLRTK